MFYTNSKQNQWHDALKKSKNPVLGTFLTKKMESLNDDNLEKSSLGESDNEADNDSNDRTKSVNNNDNSNE